MKRLKKQDKDKIKGLKKPEKMIPAAKKQPAKAVKKPVAKQVKPVKKAVKKPVAKQARVKPVKKKKPALPKKIKVKAKKKPVHKKAVTVKKKHNKAHKHAVHKKSIHVFNLKKAVSSKVPFLKKISLLFKKPEKNKTTEKKKVPEKKVWEIKTISRKYLLGPKVAVVCFVFFITLVLVLHNKGRFNVSEPLSAGLLAVVFIIFSAYSAIGFYKAMQMKKKGAGFMIDGYKPCSICKPCMQTERMLGVPGALLEFIGSKTSNKFHSPSCRLAKRITQSHIIHFKVRAKGMQMRRLPSHKLAVTLFILAITAIVILHKKGIFNITEPESIAGLAIVFALFFVYITKGALGISKSAKQKSGIKTAEAMKKIQKPHVAKAGRYETDIDRLYRLVNETGRVSVNTAAEVFGLKKEQAEEWGRILESHGLIEIEYPAVGGVQLCKKKLQLTE
ncbi:MAG: hypothetical protein KJ955_03560 [Nanoarchaeota archaeon]|nr:hypothetical protein [Nanoarchaeota archaeon]